MTAQYISGGSVGIKRCSQLQYLNRGKWKSNDTTGVSPESLNITLQPSSYMEQSACSLVTVTHNACWTIGREREYIVSSASSHWVSQKPPLTWHVMVTWAEFLYWYNGKECIGKELLDVGIPPPLSEMHMPWHKTTAYSRHGILRQYSITPATHCVGPPRMCRTRKYDIWNRWTSGINWKIKDIQTYQARLQNGKLPTASTTSPSAGCTAKNKFPPHENWNGKIQPTYGITSRRAYILVL